MLKELPPKIEDVRRCSLSEDQIRFYKDVVDNQGKDLVMTLKDPDQKVPYMLVLGDREVEARTAAPRTRSGEQLDPIGWVELADRLAEKAASRHPD